MVVIHRDIRLVVNGRDLVLGRSHLVVLRLRRHTQFPQLFVDVLHIGSDPLTDGPEIVVIQLLALGRHRPKQCTPRIDQILPLQKLLLIHQEIFLFRSHRWCHLLGSGVAEQTDQTQCLTIDRFHGAQQRRLLIQSLPRVGTKSGRYTQDRACRIMAYKCR